MNKYLMPLQDEQRYMGEYLQGDVLLASVALDDRTVPKIRPVIVICTGEDGRIHICPVSSKPPSDAPCLPIAIDDFATGGLDLFFESYVMTSRVTAIRSNEVIGKKGRLTAESLAEIVARVPVTILTGIKSGKKKSPGRLRW
jgi:mRNA interferase MazF